MNHEAFPDVVAGAVTARCAAREVPLDRDLLHLPKGLALGAADDTSAVVGFSLASGLVLSAELVSGIARLNRRSKVGHVWLTDGAPDGTYSVVVGLKYVEGLFDAATTRAQLMMLHDAVEGLRTWLLSEMRPSAPHPFLHSDTDEQDAAVPLLAYLS